MLVPKIGYEHILTVGLLWNFVSFFFGTIWFKRLCGLKGSSTPTKQLGCGCVRVRYFHGLPVWKQWKPVAQKACLWQRWTSLTPLDHAKHFKTLGNHQILIHVLHLQSLLCCHVSTLNARSIWQLMRLVDLRCPISCFWAVGKVVFMAEPTSKTLGVSKGHKGPTDLAFLAVSRCSEPDQSHQSGTWSIECSGTDSFTVTHWVGGDSPGPRHHCVYR